VLSAGNESFHVRLRGLLEALSARAHREPMPLDAFMAPSSRRCDVDLQIPTRCDVLTTLKKLPEVCLTRSKLTGSVIAIRRGELGHYPIDTHVTPEDFNARRGITPDQVQAMENGSVFGWEIPGADPDIVRALRAARGDASGLDP
jgi:hypothetical protein